MSNLLIDNKELMKDYDYNKNKDVDIKTMRYGSGKRVWWKCPKCGYDGNQHQITELEK